MPFQSVPECAEIVLNATCAGKPIANVLHARLPGGYGTGDIDALAAAVVVATNGTYQPISNGNVLFNDVTCRGLELINDYAKVDGGLSGPGTMGANPLPANVTFCATLRTGKTGRSARGRFYSFPPGDTALSATPNTFTAGYVSDVINMLIDIQTQIAVVGWSLVVVSRFTAKTLRPVGIAFPITSIAARNGLTDSQRGRLTKGH